MHIRGLHTPPSQPPVEQFVPSVLFSQTPVMVLHCLHSPVQLGHIITIGVQLRLFPLPPHISPDPQQVLLQQTRLPPPQLRLSSASQR
jgi:hypothetical protein